MNLKFIPNIFLKVKGSHQKQEINGTTLRNKTLSLLRQKRMPQTRASFLNIAVELYITPRFD